MNTYKIGMYEEVGGYVYIQAENEKEAKKIASEGLVHYSIQDFQDFCTTNREWDIIDIILEKKVIL